MNQEEPLLTFPCEFALKVMGVNSPGFAASMLLIARKHVPNLAEQAMRCKPSKNANYLAVTITIQAESREQLDQLYRELSAHPDVKMML
ncbi:MAG: DUF493 domain-containing protein [Mariprofundaceae bacterium]